ncbi:MAG: FAD-dependent oxidoreductase [Gemmatimonadota bacterium]
MNRFRLATTMLIVLSLSCGMPEPQVENRDADVLIVGAGIAGLSAALEIARSGGDVLVVDMSSVFGGHAVSAHGGLAIVGSPVQAAAQVEDSPDLAYTDFMNWGEDADEGWVRYYVDHSRTEIYDWAVGLGVEFEELLHIAGNSVPRFHNAQGRGLGLVTPIYLSGLREGVRFQWNTRVDELIFEGRRVAGIRGTQLRSDTSLELRAPVVLIATGGFQSNLNRVRNHWNTGLPFPDRMLAGSGWNSQGSGLDLAQQVNARFHRLDHQWNYVTGLPDPRYPGANRGLNVLAEHAIWVNVEGERFVNECASAKTALPALLRQPTGSYWAILDAEARAGLIVAGSGWTEEKVETLIFGNPDLVETASTIAELARETGIPEQALSETISRFNRSVDRGTDPDFGRFSSDDEALLPCQAVMRLEHPPFYAMRLYPLARKSMGGIEIDHQGHVVGRQGRTIPGLYAAGEVAGFGGINGKAGLEGTFLGPSILTGRVAGRSIVAELTRWGVIGTRALPSREDTTDQPAHGSTREGFYNAACTNCHDLASLIELERPGYWHFELSHRSILADGRQCAQCHGNLMPFDSVTHRVDPFRRARSCGNCHGLQAID